MATKQRELEIECCKAEEKVTALSTEVGELEDAIDAKRLELHKADAEVERLTTTLEEIDDKSLSGIDDGAPE